MHLKTRSGGEEVLIGSGSSAIRLSIASGTLLSEPVRLAYRLAGTDQLVLRALALHRLAMFFRDRRVPAPLFPVSAKARRQADLLRVLDVLAATSSHRAVAETLFGAALVARDWTGGSDYLRSRTHRLIRQARRLAADGHLAHLRSAFR